MRALAIFLVLVAAGFAAFCGQPFLRDNSDALIVIITVTTVFAGFLVAIIAVLGDPSTVPDGSWRVAEEKRDGVEAKLIAHVWLFFLYLIAISLLFVAVLLKAPAAEAIPDLLRVWVERLCLFFFVTSLLLTFGLPGALLKVQMARLDAEIARRRKKAKLPD